MGILESVTNDLKLAIKQKNKTNTRVLRMILSELSYASTGMDERKLTEAKVISIVSGYRKKLYDSLSAYNDVDRRSEISSEIAIVGHYLGKSDDPKKVSQSSSIHP